VQSFRYGWRFLHSARNPSPKLGVRPAVLVPGRTFNVAWVWKGGPIRPFRLWLEGREEAFVSRTIASLHGQIKEEKLQKARFATLLLAELPGERAGTREFSLPTDVIPSFEGVRARIIWLLRVEVLSEGASTFHEHKILIRTPLE
jgi:hypothetical protein